jgi:hypothetical protein
MSALVFRLRNVPEDEADDVRALLESHAIDCYETTAGNWGIAMPGIWVSDDSEAPRARALIDDYQQQRRIIKRREYQSVVRSGEAPTLKQRIQAQPLRVLGIIAFCLFIVYVSINPFLKLIESA